MTKAFRIKGITYDDFVSYRKILQEYYATRYISSDYFKDREGGIMHLVTNDYMSQNLARFFMDVMGNNHEVLHYVLHYGSSTDGYKWIKLQKEGLRGGFGL